LRSHDSGFGVTEVDGVSGEQTSDTTNSAAIRRSGMHHAARRPSDPAACPRFSWNTVWFIGIS
jgi:hypothetical protein